MWIASILLLILVVLGLQQSICNKSMKISPGFDEKESTLNNRLNTKNGKSFYLNREKRNANDDGRKFLENYGEKFFPLEENLKKLRCAFVSIFVFKY